MHRRSGPPESSRLIRMADVFRLLGFGWYFATSLAVGTGGGALLDRWLGTKPWLLIIGLLLGTAAGFYGMFKLLMPVYQARNGKKGQGRDGS